MAWLWHERRGPEWKRSWQTRTVSSLALPPPHLLAIFSIVIFFLSVSSYVNYKQLEQRAEVGLNVFLIVVAVAALFVARYMVLDGWLSVWPQNWRDKFGRRCMPTSFRVNNVPWGVAMMVALLLVMMSYQSYFHSKWFRPFWWSE